MSLQSDTVDTLKLLMQVCENLVWGKKGMVIWWFDEFHIDYRGSFYLQRLTIHHRGYGMDE